MNTVLASIRQLFWLADQDGGTGRTWATSDVLGLLAQ